MIAAPRKLRKVVPFALIGRVTIRDPKRHLRLFNFQLKVYPQLTPLYANSSNVWQPPCFLWNNWRNHVLIFLSSRSESLWRKCDVIFIFVPAIGRSCLYWSELKLKNLQKICHAGTLNTTAFCYMFRYITVFSQLNTGPWTVDAGSTRSYFK